MSTSAIEIDAVVKQFGTLRAVDQVTLRIPAGSVFGLIGPNGAGKTTTFSIIAGFLSATSGCVRVLGHDAMDRAKLNGRVGVLPQDAVLPPGESVAGFLTHLARLQGIAARDAKPAVDSALERVGGADWRKTSCGALSHGMAKRVSLAQALLGKPELLLLDEPTAGLDPKVAFQTRQLIRELGAQSTVVVSSHNLQELEEVCTHAAIMDHGRLVSDGSMAALTGASEEIHVLLAEGPAPVDIVRAVAGVRTAEFDRNTRSMRIVFDPAQRDAETVIAAVLRALLDANARISGLGKGRKLEQKVMEVT